jgi:hypothetical protein
MGTLEDQLKKWKQQQPAEKKPSVAASPDKATRRSSTKKDPYPSHTLRRDDPVPARAAAAPAARTPPSDAELFARAVQDVDRDVVLQKFDAGASVPSATRGARGAAVAPPPTDQELFLSFVGGARPTASASTPPRAAPQARLSLRGATGDVAARRLRAFLDDAVRAGATSVVVDVDDGSDAALQVARGHAAVLSVRDASAAEGGKGARVVRFKT